MTQPSLHYTDRKRTPFADRAGELMLEIVDGYWHKLRGDKATPQRQDMSPAVLDVALPHCFIAERNGPGMARFRVAGQAIRDLTKVDPKGAQLGTLLASATREALMPLLEAVFTDPAIVEVNLHAHRGIGRPDMKARLLLMPLRDRADEETRLLGTLVTDAPAGLRRTQFHLSPDPIARYVPVTAPQMKIRLVAEARPQAASKRAEPLLQLVVNNC